MGLMMMVRSARRASRRKTLVLGTATLAFSNIACKILGFLYKVPLANLIGSEGMGYFSFAYQIFNVVTVIAVSGMPIMLAKTVAEKEREGHGEQGWLLLKDILKLFAALGLSASLILIVFSGKISALAGNPDARYALMALAPSAFFISMSSAYRGYFQGTYNMLPSAVSHVTEATGKLIFGIALAYFLWRAALPVPLVSAGAISGVTLGALSGFSLLSLWALKTAKSYKGFKAYDRTLKKKLLLSAFPLTLGALFLSFTNTVDALLIMNRLKNAGFDTLEATRLYGAYSGYAITLFTFPFALTGAVSSATVPLVAGSAGVSRNGLSSASHHVQNAFKLIAAIVAPVSAGFYLMPKELLSLLFSRASDVEMAAPLLKTLAPACALSAFSALTVAVLEAGGHIVIPMAAMGLGGLVKLASNYVLIGIPEVNIQGAPIGSLLCHIVTLTINLSALVFKFRVKIRFWENVFPPLVCGAACAFVAFFACRELAFLREIRLRVLLSLAAAAIVYLFLLFFIGILNKNDLKKLRKSVK